MSGQKASKILKRLGFTNWIRVEALGFSGGICLLWRNSEFDADYVYSNPQLLHCLVTKRKTRESVLVTGVYGESNPSSWSCCTALPAHSFLSTSYHHFDQSIFHSYHTIILLLKYTEHSPNLSRKWSGIGI